ncbi:MAG: PHP domain-containing protein [Lachnospiraceae bacterium]|nr:PHP domain-containing protein [Lachnospiraceae bacterium]
MRYENYHKHSHYSNIRTLDSICKPEEYMKRAVELGHKNYFTTEHGFQGNIFEAYTLCQKYGLKCIYAVEAYYIDDISDKTNRINYHIMLVAMTESGRKQINQIMSVANQQGYYYKPRIDLKLLLSLNPDDVIVTTACVASKMFKGDNWYDEFFIPVFNHFKDNFYLEVQNHNSQVQIEHNKKILAVKNKFGIKIIHANDSHYIYPADSKYRDLFLKAKGILYENENDFILDYPDTDTIIERYKKQNVLNDDEIREALESTLIFDSAEGINLDKEFKIPNINKEILKKEIPYVNADNNDDEILKDIIKYEWNVEKTKIPDSRLKEYQEAIYYEMDIIQKCGMARYFILDYIIVKKAVNEYNAVLTRSGRGSAVSFYVNHLLGLTEIDRLKAPITLYPTRFMSAERILNSKSLPDIDLNFSDIKPVIKASKDILGENGIYYMVAYKPLQESSAFRLWCKANNYNIKEYDEIAKNLNDYINDKKWSQIIEESKIFRGVIESIAPSPCSFLLLDKPIPDEVGLIRVGNSNNYEICCCIDGYNCDVYKYLKNDFLTVKCYEIIDKVYQLAGRPIDDISTLINNCDSKVWDIYAKGLTTTINQSDSDFAKQTLKRYKPSSLAEMSAWVAAIRPGFASLLNNFLDRKPYSTGVAELDKILKDSFNYMMYQESIMKYLVWLRIEEKGTYDIIKKIAKKKFTDIELNELQKKLQENWEKTVGNKKGFNETWQVVQDAARYSFNASHSLSVAIDSLYGAYLKSHYPLEYFTVVLSLYSDDKTRTANLINELTYFNIKLKPIKFGKSKADYSMDRETNSIYKGIASIKYCNATIADELLSLSQNKYVSFIDLLSDIKSNTSVNSRQLEILTKLNFFSDFGKNKYLTEIIKIYDEFESTKIIFKKKLSYYEQNFGLSEYVISKYSAKETNSQYRDLDNAGIINELTSKLKNTSLPVQEQVKFEIEHLEYTTYINDKIPDDCYIVIEFKTYKDNAKPYITLRNIHTGEEVKTRIKYSKIYKKQPFELFSILKIKGFTIDFKSKFADGKWISSDEQETILEKYEVLKK